MSGHVFGPVPSRRLGRSLGIDLVPFKTCSYDCVYCQLGHTTCKTIQRKEWLPLDDTLAELKDRLRESPDYITLSGSGEPTLHSGTGEAVDRIKSMTDVPVAVLTNGSLLWQEEVRRELRDADLVIPSLDAGDPVAFQEVNRPHEAVSFENLLEGLIAFRRQFRGAYWLEVFLIADVTATDAQVARLAECVDKIQPDRVQLNTVTRPPADSRAAAVASNVLVQLAARFRPKAEVIAAFPTAPGADVFTISRERVLELLARRPCTLDDLAQGLRMHPNEVLKHVEHLAAEGHLRRTRTEGRLYYHASR